MKRTMRISLLNILGYYLSGVWTAWGGRNRIGKKQVTNLRKLVKKLRQDSPVLSRALRWAARHGRTHAE